MLSDARVSTAGAHGESETLVLARDVGKQYQLYGRPHERLLDQVLRRSGRRFGRAFWALRDISVELRRGETLGIIGRNGSGKSTLLQILAGIVRPTTGKVRVTGRVASLLELGSGFHPEYSGRDNVYLSGAIAGLSQKTMETRFAEIEAFADIGEFIDQPVKTYSSGMFVRLAFAVQICLDPDVLLVDEVLSVGDVFFQQKCHERMEELLRRRRSALVLASHDMTAIEKYSTRAMVLDHGRCLFIGQPNEAVERYYQTEYAPSPALSTALPAARAAPSAPVGDEAVSWWPTAKDVFVDPSRGLTIGDVGTARCTAVAMCAEDGRPRAVFAIGEAIEIYYEFELLQDIGVPIGGVVITNAKNINIHGKNSLQHMVAAPPSVASGARVRFRQRIELTVAPGEYTFQVGLATVSAEDYDRAGDIPHALLHPRIREILRVRQVGRFTVHERARGISLPFHGYADLRGECALSVVEFPARSA
jgi:homopolymeric O-antigen transport system ATP-binding protein